MDFYKEYVYNLRQLLLKHVCVLTNEHEMFNLFKFINALNKVVDFSSKATEDGHFYCKIKKIVKCWLTYWERIFRGLEKSADFYSNAANKDELRALLDEAVQLERNRERNYIDTILKMDETDSSMRLSMTLKSKAESKSYVLVVLKLKRKLKFLNNEEAVRTFAKDIMIRSQNNKKQVFDYTNMFIANQLIKHIPKIKDSLTARITRLERSLRYLEKKHKENLDLLRHELYETNMELYAEKTRRQSNESFEIFTSTHNEEHEIIKGRLKNKLLRLEPPPCIYHVQEELNYYINKYNTIVHIAKTIAFIENELQNVKEEIREIENKDAQEESHCSNKMKTNLQNKKNYLEDKRTEASKSIITFFSDKDYDLNLEKNEVGLRHMDRFGHQTFSFDETRLNVYHVTCDHDLIQFPEYQTHYFDENGRYTLNVKGEKLYQLAACTSQYELASDGTLSKTTKDCGHSERPNDQCGVDLKFLCDTVKLPKVEKCNIKNTLSPEAVKYLWSSLCHILPLALKDVAEEQPRNPIHYLAHRLLYHKCSKSYDDLKDLSEDAQRYRDEKIHSRYRPQKRSS